MDFTQSMDNGYMIPSSIAVGSGEATDIRCVCDTVEDFKAFLDTTGMELRYEGLVTYEKINKLLKVYKGNDTWQTVGGNEESNESIDTSNFITLAQLSQQLSNYYTKTQADNKISEEIAKAQLGGTGEVDLSAYATKNYVNEEITRVESEINNFEIKAIPNGIVTPQSTTFLFENTNEVVYVESIALNKSNSTLKVGESEILTASITPLEATNKSIFWSSSDNSVITINNGTVNAISVGNATITAASSNGKKSMCVYQVTGNDNNNETNIKNLYDDSTKENGYLRKSDGGIIADSYCYTSNFIPVESGKEYSINISEGLSIIYYNSNKAKVSHEDTWKQNIVAPSDAAYIRFSAGKGVFIDVMFVEGNTIPDTYIPYVPMRSLIRSVSPCNDVISGKSYYLSENIEVKYPSIAKALSNLNMNNNILTNEEVEAVTNLYDDNAKSNGYLRVSDGSLISDSYCYASDFIKTHQEKNYCINFNSTVCFYDENKRFVSSISGETMYFTTPKNTHYTRFSSGKGNFVNTMFVNSKEIPSLFVPYNPNPNVVMQKYLSTDIKIKKDSLEDVLSLIVSSTTSSKLKGLKWNCLGDSITFGAGTTATYHKIISDNTGCTVRNYGINSSTIGTQFVDSWNCNPMCERYVNMDNDADIVTVFGGVNDAGGGIDNPTVIGDIDSFDTKTFCGAYNTLLKGLIEKYPTSIIATFIPLQAADSGRNLNSLKEIREAIIKISAKYSIACLDLNSMSGICPDLTVHSNKYMPDKLHPNFEGHKKISKIIQSFLENLI